MDVAPLIDALSASGSITVTAHYWIAVAGGLFMLLLLAGDQLDRHAGEAGTHRQEVLDLARPSDITGAVAFGKALAVYAVLLSVLYLICCFVPLGVWEAIRNGEDVAGFDLEQGVRFDQIWVPPSISLGLVGFSKPSAIGQTIERKFRTFALRMIKVPKQLWAMTDAVQRTKVSLAPALSSVETSRIMACREAAKTHLGAASDRFGEALERIAALRLWLFDAPAGFPAPTQRTRFGRLATALAGRHDALMDGLKLLIVDGREPDNASDQILTRWREAAGRALEIEDQFCALLALHVGDGRATDAAKAAEDPQFAAFLRAFAAERQVEPADFNIITGVTFCVAVAMGLYYYIGASAGLSPPAFQNAKPASTALVMVLAALVWYAPPSATLTLLRHSRVTARPSRWRPAFSGGSFPWLQQVAVAGWCYGVAAVFIIGFYLFLPFVVSVDVTLFASRNLSITRLGDVLPEALGFSVLAAAQGVALGLLLDRAEARTPSWRDCALAGAAQGVAFLTLSIFIHDLFRDDVWAHWYDWTASAVFGATAGFATLFFLRPATEPAGATEAAAE